MRKTTVLVVAAIFLQSSIQAANLQALQQLREGVSKWMQQKHRIEQSAETSYDEESEEMEEATIEQTSYTKKKFTLSGKRKFVERPGHKSKKQEESPSPRAQAPAKRARTYVTKPVPKISDQPMASLPAVVERVPEEIFALEEAPVKSRWVSKRPAAQLSAKYIQ